MLAVISEAALDRQQPLVLDHAANSNELLPDLLGRKVLRNLFDHTEDNALFLSCPRCGDLLELVGFVYYQQINFMCTSTTKLDTIPLVQ